MTITALIYIIAILLFVAAAAIAYGRTKVIDLTDIGLALFTLGTALALGVF